MEAEERNALMRIHQAETARREGGQAPCSFKLLHTGAMRSQIDHPCWDPSWAVPSEHTIDDLADRGLLRVEPSHNKSRDFVLTPDGRAAAAAIAEQATMPIATEGHAPAATDVLEWLIRVEKVAPATFRSPSLLLDRAVADQLVSLTGRESLARRILALADEGYVSGLITRTFGATDEQTLKDSTDLGLTMRAHQSMTQPSTTRTINVFGDVIDSQIAAGNITSYTTFVELLDRAITEIDGIDEVDNETKEEAKGVLARLRGKAAEASGEVATGAAGDLAAAVLARLVGLPLG
ncbi:MAG: hypothetical protein MSC31_09965 [Solirubrobacteraceae bacterium MAG38_C4-C5]|nr:hypothetical protein [Candidatus Siliceabacter maunaloa]